MKVDLTLTNGEIYIYRERERIKAVQIKASKYRISQVVNDSGDILKISTLKYQPALLLGNLHSAFSWIFYRHSL